MFPKKKGILYVISGYSVDNPKPSEAFKVVHLFKSYQNFKMERGKTENWEKLEGVSKKNLKKSWFSKTLKKLTS